MLMGITITPDDTTTPIAPKPSYITDGLGITELRGLAGDAHYELVHVSLSDYGTECYLILDEEGRLKGLPVNWVASVLFGRMLCGPVSLVPSQWIQ